MPGQMVLGGEPPPVSRRSRDAVARAASLLLPQRSMDVLWALDRAVRGKRSCSTREVREELEEMNGGATFRSQWVVRRLAELAEQRLVFAEVETDRYEWSPGE